MKWLKSALTFPKKLQKQQPKSGITLPSRGKPPVVAPFVESGVTESEEGVRNQESEKKKERRKFFNYFQVWMFPSELVPPLVFL